MLRVERHLHGPRVYVLGRRVHEWHLGLAVLAGAALAAPWHRASAAVAAFVAAWLVAKDWRDIRPSTRDTSAWRLGIHRAASSLRDARGLDGLPVLASGVALLMGGGNMVWAVW